MGQTLTATLENAQVSESSQPSSSSSIKRIPVGAFKPGPDPRRSGGLKPGMVNHKTREAREIAREILIPRTADACNVLVSLLGEYKDKSDPCPECQRTPCKTCGRGMPADPCPLCGRGMLRDEDTRFKAVQDILDRVGVPKQTKIELEANVNVHSVTWVKHLTDDELQQMIRFMNLAQERALQAGELSPEDIPPEEEEVL